MPLRKFGFIPLKGILADNRYEGIIIHRILKHLAIANVLSLFSTFMSGLFELANATFDDFLDIISRTEGAKLIPESQICGSLSSWFRVVYALLNVLLAFNRFSVAFDFSVPYEGDIHRYLIFLVWYALVVLIIMTAYLKIDFRYDLDTHWFNAPAVVFDQPVWILRYFISFIYVVVVVRLVYLKLNRRQGVSKYNLHVLFQFLALHLPSELSSILRRVLKDETNQSSRLNVLLLFIYRAVPAITISILLLMNRNLCRQVLAIPGKMKNRIVPNERY
ncbi:hypothetical protein QR680_009863 [Steinernema hermaphroditum]|uniref:Uncharacterized protein n=1 Tax=Steinernema hermaphroditum TaxID=289476 RepID=A0AA39INL1_9BILA|nr:hypothetical protein QR680_009863 [Steinernema hermaphroditum]